MRKNRSRKRRQKQHRQKQHRQHVRPQQRASHRKARPRKGQPRRNAPRNKPQLPRVRPRHARCNIRLRKGQPRRNAPRNEQQLQRVRPHHAPLIHRPGQRRRRPATLCRPLRPQHQRARSCATSNARSAHYARKKLVSCEPFRLRSALRNSRTSISSASSARSSGYSLTSRRSRTHWFAPMLKCRAACAVTASRV